MFFLLFFFIFFFFLFFFFILVVVLLVRVSSLQSSFAHIQTVILMCNGFTPFAFDIMHSLRFEMLLPFEKSEIYSKNTFSINQYSILGHSRTHSVSHQTGTQFIRIFEYTLTRESNTIYRNNLLNLLCRILTNQFLFICSAIVLFGSDAIQQQFKLLPIAICTMQRSLCFHSGSIS